MFNSLRSRLWLSNIVLIFIVFLFLVGGLILVFINSPLSYRQTAVRLKVVESNISERIFTNSISSREKLAELLLAEGEKNQVRFILINNENRILFDSGTGKNSQISGVRFNLNTDNLDSLRLSNLRDVQKIRWLYTASKINNNLFLVTLTPSPLFKISNLIRDDIFVPSLRAIVVSLLVAFGLSLGLAKWISGPLQNLVGGVHDLSKGQFRSLPLEGPDEVQELADAFNNLSKKVKDNQQSQRDFIANVSHELKTPLTSIQGFAQSIVDGTANGPISQKNAGKVIFAEANRMHRLVLDLLTLTRLESGAPDLNPTQIILEEIIKNVMVRFQPQAAEAEVQLDFTPSGVTKIVADGDRLAQVFSNLIDNAIKYNHKKGSVIITTRIEGDYSISEITDSGKGIAQADVERIFERFYQVDKSRKGSPGRGVGLGLSIAQKIVFALGGNIMVESILEKGTKFIVKLPLNMKRSKMLDEI
jgi:two-component system, OmpR family, sensor kinase